MYVHPSSAKPIYIQGPNLILIAPSDAQAPDRARPDAQHWEQNYHSFFNLNNFEYVFTAQTIPVTH